MMQQEFNYRSVCEDIFLKKRRPKEFIFTEEGLFIISEYKSNLKITCYTLVGRNTDRSQSAAHTTNIGNFIIHMPHLQ